MKQNPPTLFLDMYPARTWRIAHHRGALLECETTVSLWLPERKFGERMNDMLETLPYF